MLQQNRYSVINLNIIMSLQTQIQTKTYIKSTVNTLKINFLSVFLISKSKLHIYIYMHIYIYIYM
jgi:hypothetical protein